MLLCWFVVCDGGEGDDGEGSDGEGSEGPVLRRRSARMLRCAALCCAVLRCALPIIQHRNTALEVCCCAVLWCATMVRATMGRAAMVKVLEVHKWCLKPTTSRAARRVHLGWGSHCSQRRETPCLQASAAQRQWAPCAEHPRAAEGLDS